MREDGVDAGVCLCAGSLVGPLVVKGGSWPPTPTWPHSQENQTSFALKNYTFSIKRKMRLYIRSEKSVNPPGKSDCPSSSPFSFFLKEN